jgi:DNA-binding response OmpR family regulator
MNLDSILLVEDDEKLGEQIVGHLKEAGFEPTWIRDGDDARRVAPEEYRLIILDLMLPGTYGLDLLKLYRQVSDVPVLILSARNDTADKVRSLALGADDYVTKPFWPEELIARVAARLRRPGLRRGDTISLGRVRIDLSIPEVSVDGDPLELTRVELGLLSALAKRPGSAMTRRALMEAALDPERQGTERTLDVHISRLRKKLGLEGWRIETVWGIGYRLSDAKADPA